MNITLPAHLTAAVLDACASPHGEHPAELCNHPVGIPITVDIPDNAAAPAIAAHWSAILKEAARLRGGDTREVLLACADSLEKSRWEAR